MTLKVSYCGVHARVGVAIFAKVGTGVVLADVLAGDAATELSLTFVLVVFTLYSITVFRYLYSSIRKSRSIIK